MKRVEQSLNTSQSPFIFKGVSINDVHKNFGILTPPVRRFTQPPLLRLLTRYVCF